MKESNIQQLTSKENACYLYFNGDYEEAFEAYKKLHQEEPGEISIAHSLYECMLKIGIDYKSYPWQCNFTVYTEVSQVLDAFYELISKQGRLSMFYLLSVIDSEGYNTCDDDLVIQKIKYSKRFLLEYVSTEWFPYIDIQQ